MNFKAEDIRNGNRNLEKAKETPNSFTEISGSAQATDGNDLSATHKRMAGQEGARALEMMNDPMEQERTAKWMQMFSTSNQGKEWNAAKMGLPPQG